MNELEKGPVRGNSRRGGCRRVLFFLALLILLGSGLTAVAAVRWQSNLRARGIFYEDAAPQLSPVQKLYLANYLAQRAADLARPLGSPPSVTIEIPPGATADAVITDLMAAGLLKERELFLNYLRFYGLDSFLQAGQFTLETPLAIPDLAALITQGSARDVTLNFLPGMRLEEAVHYLTVTAPAQIDADEFEDLVQRRSPLDTTRYPFLNSLPADQSLEGYLYPGAYRVPSDADASYLLDLMLRNFDRQVNPALRQAYGAAGLSLHQAVTLASIIERETMADEERATMASVYLNRLKLGMPLQADPTVQYAVGYQPANNNWWKVPLTLADLQFPHPYNTYMNGDLPPGPIASPGLSALQAIAEPEQTDFLFFVLDCHADPPGRHIFSRTYEEHLANVERCR